MMKVCNPARFVCTFTYDKQIVWLKSLVTHKTSWVTIHNASILLATISSFSTEPQHSSKTVLLHKYSLHYPEYKTLHYTINYTNLLVISFSKYNSNAWKLHTAVHTAIYTVVRQHVIQTFIYIPSAQQHVRTPDYWYSQAHL